jgi:hypothetical protein
MTSYEPTACADGTVNDKPTDTNRPGDQLRGLAVWAKVVNAKLTLFLKIT